MSYTIVPEKESLVVLLRILSISEQIFLRYSILLVCRLGFHAGLLVGVS